MNKVVKIFFVIIVFFFINSLVYSQTVTWQTWYDYNNYDNDGNEVIQTFDGGYMFLGQNYAVLNSGAILIKTNPLGIIQWQKLIDRNIVGGNGIICYSIVQSKDSGYTVSGYTLDSAVLFKTYPNGELQWLKKYSRPNQKMSFYDHKISYDGGIIACGDLYPPFQGVILKTDSVGNLMWDSLSNIHHKVIQANDSSYYFGGANEILKTNLIGEKIWSVKLSSIGPFMVESSSGFLYTGGYPGVDTMILHKLDSSGNLIWKKKYYPGGHCQCLCLSKDGKKILLAGYIDTLVQGNIVVTKVDLEGNLIYNKQIFSAFGYNLSFLPYSVKATSDNGFVLTGFTNFPRFTSYRDNILAVKTDSLCNAPIIVNVDNNNQLTPEEFVLYQNYPNPFNPVTTITYSIPISGIVKIKIYDITGREIRLLVNEAKDAGAYEIQFDGSNLASGIYFYKLEAGSFISTKRMILIK
ncbi:MAG: T9SS type A sorting domain-containing protein [Ignavibacteria bacterium]|nr:T9SS type A sorting domain-containing protein [Ignavibacteria bacterium]